MATSVDESQEEDSNVEGNTKANRPDPAFKFQTRQIAEQLGLETVEAELPQTLRADLILAVPEGISIEGTLFSFFRPLNVPGFKSQGDKFDEYEFVKNEVRTGLLFLQKAEAGSPVGFEDILNLIVCSRFPQGFFDYMREHNCVFRAEEATPWLWRCRVGLQEVAVVVCRDLPIEASYYK